MKQLVRQYFGGSLVVTALGLLLGLAVAAYYENSLAGIARVVFVVVVLAVLEISLSFDNAVVNAAVLRTMTPVWRHRFLTWGIAIAVFGMRLVFPLLVVSVVASVTPLEALRLATFEPTHYARILTSAQPLLGAFGGAFLGMVSLKYFLDAEKQVHWIYAIESRLARLGKVEAAGLAVMMLTLWAFSTATVGSQRSFLVAGLVGLVTYILVDGVSMALKATPGERASVHRASAASFLYLEVLDASFSFDGVIGAFALTNNLFVIAIGLGIGAMFVRSLTVMLVDQGTLASYRYLEHGAYWAIGALALLMLVNTVVDVPDAATGLIGAAFIGLSLWQSVRYNRRKAGRPPAAP